MLNSSHTRTLQGLELQVGLRLGPKESDSNLEPEDTDWNIVDSTVMCEAHVMQRKHLQTFEELIQVLSSTWFLYMDFPDLEKNRINAGLEINDQQEPWLVYHTTTQLLLTNETLITMHC